MLPLRDANPLHRTPAITAVILAACATVFGYELVLLVQGGDPALNRFLVLRGLVPAELAAALGGGGDAPGPTLDLLTHMFLHAGWLHLMGNALFLWIFAPRVEDRLGRPLFLALYLVGGVVAALAHVATDPASEAPMVGASGAISAVLGAYVVLFPRARIQSLVFVVFFYDLVAVPAVLVLGFWFVLQLIDGFASLGLTTEASGGTAFWAHIGGFLAGLAMALVVGRLRPAAPLPGPLPRAATPNPPLPPPPPRP